MTYFLKQSKETNLFDNFFLTSSSKMSIEKAYMWINDARMELVREGQLA